MRARDLDRLVGMPYRPDFNCAHFVEYAMRELFGRDVRLPGGGPRDPSSAAADYGLAPTDAPKDGDLVLMFEFGRKRADHVGLYFHLAHEGWVLHNNARTGSVFHRIREFGALGLGLRIEGYYEWA